MRSLLPHPSSSSFDELCAVAEEFGLEVLLFTDYKTLDFELAVGVVSHEGGFQLYDSIYFTSIDDIMVASSDLRQILEQTFQE